VPSSLRGIKLSPFEIGKTFNYLAHLWQPKDWAVVLNFYVQDQKVWIAKLSGFPQEAFWLGGEQWPEFIPVHRVNSDERKF